MVDGSKILEGNGDVHLLIPNGKTNDIIRSILAADMLGVDYVKDFAEDLRGEDVLQTCYNIYNFLHTQIPFIEDPDGQQFIVLPGQAYKNRKKEFGGNGFGIDCKSFSLFASSLLRCLGYYNFKYRFVSQSKNDELHHVYIIVETEGGYIPLDCTLNEFCIEMPFVKHEDRNPTGHTGIGAPVRKIYVGAPTVDIENSWVNVETDLANNIEYVRQNTKDHFFAGLYFSNKNRPLKLDIINNKVRKNWELFETVAFCLLYKFWDRNAAPFPSDTSALNSMFPGLADKLQFSEGLYNSFMEMGARDGDVRALCTVSCYNQFGVSMDYMLYRCYNTVKYGQPWTPVIGVPYLDMKTMSWKMNGGTTDQILKISFCFPYGNGTYVGMARPYGTPYWCNGGWVMQNGFSDNESKARKMSGYANIEAWIIDNPMPDGLLTRTPTEELIQDATALYYQWINGNMPGLPVDSKGDKLRNRPGVNGPAVGYLPVAEIVAIVVAVVSAVATIAALVAKLVAAFKKPNGGKEVPVPQDDFKWEYRTVDGGYIYRNANGGYDKCDANGQNCQTNVDLNDPANQAGSNSFLDNPNTLKYAGLALLGTGAIMYINNNSNNN